MNPNEKQRLIEALEKSAQQLSILNTWLAALLIAITTLMSVLIAVLDSKI